MSWHGTLRASHGIQRVMAHTQAALADIILSTHVMSVSRFQNIPKPMVLEKPRLSALQEYLSMLLTARSSSSNFILT
jgi:hypothetical protein